MAATIKDGRHDASLARLLATHAGAQADASTLRALEDSSTSSYLSSIMTMPLASIRQQPPLLHSASNNLDSQLSALCLRQVPSFVKVHAASTSLPPAMAQLDVSLQSLLEESLPALERTSKDFHHLSQPCYLELQSAKALAETHQISLADLLDLPRLVETCVRSSYSHEALQLAIHIAKLANPESSPLRVGEETPTAAGATLEALRDEVWSSLAKLRAQLVRQLEAKGLKLPTVKRALANLRKLEEVDEAAGESSAAPTLALDNAQLCLAFLRARQTLLPVSPSPSKTTSDAFSPKGKTLIDIACSEFQSFVLAWREVVTDTLSMSVSMFASVSGSASGSAGQRQLCRRLISAHLDLALQSLVSSLRDTLTRLVSVRDASPLVIASALNTLHTQLSYTSTSMARFGADFGAALRVPDDSASAAAGERIQTFEEAALRLFARAVEDGLKAWSRSVQASDLFSRPQAPLLLQDTLEHFARGEEEGEGSMPRSLTAFPAVARLLNSLLPALEGLRAFAPASTADDARSILDDALLSALKRVQALAENMSADDAGRLDLVPLSNGDGRDIIDESSRDVEAVRALCGRAVVAFVGPCSEWIRGALQQEVFVCAHLVAPGKGLGDAMREAKVWAEDKEVAWMEGERERREEVTRRKEERKKREEQERLAREAEMERLRIQRDREEKERRERIQAEERARREAEERAKREAEEKARKEAEAKTQREAEERARREAEEKARREAEARAQREAEEKAEAEAEEKARAEAEEKARREAEEQASQEAEDKARREAEEKARKESEEKAEAERIAREAEEAERGRLEAEEAERRNEEAEAAAKAERDVQAKVAAEAEAQAKRQEDERQRREREEEEERRRQAEAEAEAERQRAAKEEEDRQKPEGVREMQRAESQAASTTSAAPSSLDANEVERDVAVSSTSAPTDDASTPATPATPSTDSSTATKHRKGLSLAEKLKQRADERERREAEARRKKEEEEKGAVPTLAETETSQEQDAADGAEQAGKADEASSEPPAAREQAEQPAVVDELGNTAAEEGTRVTAPSPADAEGDQDDEEEDDNSVPSRGTSTPTGPNDVGDAGDASQTTSSTGAKKKKNKKKKKGGAKG